MENEYEVWNILVRYDNRYLPIIKHYLKVSVIQFDPPFTEENAREACTKEYKNLKGFFIKSIKKL